MAATGFMCSLLHYGYKISRFFPFYFSFHFQFSGALFLIWFQIRIARKWWYAFVQDVSV